MEHYHHQDRYFQHLLSMPFIWMMIVPLVLLDIFLEIYHSICFPLYGLPYVPRKNYVRLDRHKLRYLPWYDKINCAYCGYANGLIHYAQVIAGETERYWCAIKHQQRTGFVEPSHHKEFIPYGDEAAWRELVSSPGTPLDTSEGQVQQAQPVQPQDLESQEKHN